MNFMTTKSYRCLILSQYGISILDKVEANAFIEDEIRPLIYLHRYL